jgi:hypothetical protein
MTVEIYDVRIFGKEFPVTGRIRKHHHPARSLLVRKDVFLGPGTRQPAKKQQNK